MTRLNSTSNCIACNNAPATNHFDTTQTQNGKLLLILLFPTAKYSLLPYRKSFGDRFVQQVANRINLTNATNYFQRTLLSTQRIIQSPLKPFNGGWTSPAKLLDGLLSTFAPIKSDLLSIRWGKAVVDNRGSKEEVSGEQSMEKFGRMLVCLN
jgi:hypothetical protein